MKGKLTKRRYSCATIFVDHWSRLRFVHLQIDDSYAKTLAAKRTFETFAAEHGVKILHYQKGVLESYQIGTYVRTQYHKFPLSRVSLQARTAYQVLRNPNINSFVT